MHKPSQPRSNMRRLILVDDGRRRPGWLTSSRRVPLTPYEQSPPPRAPTTHISPRPLLRHRQLHGAPIHLQPDRPLQPPHPPPTPTRTEPPTLVRPFRRVTAVGGRPSPQRKGVSAACHPGEQPKYPVPPSTPWRRNSSKRVSGGNAPNPVSSPPGRVHAPAWPCWKAAGGGPAAMGPEVARTGLFPR